MSLYPRYRALELLLYLHGAKRMLWTSVYKRIADLPQRTSFSRALSEFQCHPSSFSKHYEKNSVLCFSHLDKGKNNILNRRLLSGNHGKCVTCNSNALQSYRHMHISNQSYHSLVNRKLFRSKPNIFECSGFKRHMSTDYSSIFTFKNQLMRDYLDSLIEEYEEINTDLQKGERNKRKHIRMSALAPIVEATRTLKSKHQEMEELRKLQTDPEMSSLATEDEKACAEEIEQRESELMDLLMVEDAQDDFDIIVEVAAGVGGQEAALFALEVFNMYAGHAAYKGWEFLELDRKTAEHGGILSASASVSGSGVYREMKFEGGVHRVQRVPQTEMKDRTHTSTMTVAILPQPSEIDVVINEKKDLKIDFFRASGRGGQSVNVSNSAVRVTHLPTGIVAENQNTRSQAQNLTLAMTVVRTRIYEREYEAQLSQEKSRRKLQVGNKGRNEKIRTYNFPQDRISDHRVKSKYNQVETFMMGGEKLESMTQELIEESKKENLMIKLEEFEACRDLKQKKQKKR